MTEKPGEFSESVQTGVYEENSISAVQNQNRNHLGIQRTDQQLIARKSGVVNRGK